MTGPGARAYRVAACALVAGSLGGCGGSGADERRQAPREALAAGSQVLSRNARYSSNDRPFTLLRVPRVGRVVVTCDRQRRSRISFRTDSLLPTSDVLVDVAGRRPVARTIQPRRLFTPDKTPRGAAHQTWHIAPFAAAQVRLATLSVTTQALHGREPFECAASALAVVGPDQGPTAQG